MVKILTVDISVSTLLKKVNEVTGLPLSQKLTLSLFFSSAAFADHGNIFP